MFRGSAPIPPAQNAVTRPLNTAFQISLTRPAMAFYSIQVTVTASISSGQDGDVFLDIADDQAFTQDVQTIQVSPNSQTYTLAVALQGVQKGNANVQGLVPAASWARIRTANNIGSPVFTYRAGQEVLM